MKFTEYKRSREEAAEEIDMLQRARAAREEIRQLNLDFLKDPSKTTRLPYPGYGYATVRPLEDTVVVGMPDLDDMLGAWQHLRPPHQILAVGPKGVGKSTRLRAFACILYATHCSTASKKKLLCIWNANTAVSHSIQNAFRFCYCEEPEVVEEIEKMSSTGDYLKFMKTRQVKFGETFSVIVDAAQKLDVQTCTRALRDDAAVHSQRSMESSMFLANLKVCWGVSPMAAMMGAYAWNPEPTVHLWIFDEPLSVEAKETFLNNSVVGMYVKKFPERETDVQFYAGNYPLFLDLLDRCCRWVARMKQQKILRYEGRRNLSVVDNLTETDIIDLLADQNDWDTVLDAFEKHAEIKSIMHSFKNMKITQTYHSKAEMMDVDSRYVLNKEKGLYCSQYIEQLYIDAFRELEHKHGLEERYGPWISYAKYLLKETILNWSELGWLCERVCTSVVSKYGICIDSLDIGELKAIRFTLVPKLEQLRNGQGIVYIPNRFNFGCVDAVVVYMDQAGKIHFIGLQVTTSLDRHMHSVDQFMCVSVIQEWIPSALTLSRTGSWNFHFVFLCLESKEAVLKSESVSELRTGVQYGTLAHTLHVRSFEDAFGMGRVGPDVHQTLRELARLRENEYAMVEPAPSLPNLQATSGGPLKMTKSQVKKLKRRELNAIAEVRGLTPENYKTIDYLVEALKAAGHLVIE